MMAAFPSTVMHYTSHLYRTAQKKPGPLVMNDRALSTYSPYGTSPTPIPTARCASNFSLLRLCFFLIERSTAFTFSIASWHRKQITSRFSLRRSCLSNGLPGVPSAKGSPHRRGLKGGSRKKGGKKRTTSLFCEKVHL